MFRSCPDVGVFTPPMTDRPTPHTRLNFRTASSNYYTRGHSKSDFIHQRLRFFLSKFSIQVVNNIHLSKYHIEWKHRGFASSLDVRGLRGLYFVVGRFSHSATLNDRFSPRPGSWERRIAVYRARHSVSVQSTRLDRQSLLQVGQAAPGPNRGMAITGVARGSRVPHCASV